jgi:hypothetical protein
MITVAVAAAMESGGAQQWSEEASGIPEARRACWAATSSACLAATCVLSGDGGDLAGVLDGDLVVLGGGVRAERRRRRPRGRAGRRPSVVLGGGVLGAACGGLMGGPEPGGGRSTPVSVR